MIVFKKLAEEIASELGGAISKEAEEGAPAWFYVMLPGKVEIALHFDGYGNKGKVNVSGNYPRDKDGNYYGVREVLSYDAKAPEINANFSKSAVQIAGDIKRRLLPELGDIFAKAHARIAQHEAYNNAKESMLSKIAAAGHIKYEPNPKGNGLYGAYEFQVKSVDVDARKVRLEIEVPLADAIELAKRFAAKKGGAS